MIKLIKNIKKINKFKKEASKIEDKNKNNDVLIEVTGSVKYDKLEYLSMNPYWNINYEELKNKKNNKLKIYVAVESNNNKNDDEINKLKNIVTKMIIKKFELEDNIEVKLLKLKLDDKNPIYNIFEGDLMYQAYLTSEE